MDFIQYLIIAVVLIIILLALIKATKKEEMNMRKANCKPKLNRELVIKCQVSKNNEEHLEVSIDHCLKMRFFFLHLFRKRDYRQEILGWC